MGVEGRWSKGQTSSSKVSKYRGCNAHRDGYSQHCCLIQGSVERVNPESSFQKKFFFSFSFFFLLYLHEMMGAN